MDIILQGTYIFSLLSFKEKEPGVLLSFSCISIHFSFIFMLNVYPQESHFYAGLSRHGHPLILFIYFFSMHSSSISLVYPSFSKSLHAKNYSAPIFASFISWRHDVSLLEYQCTDVFKKIFQNFTSYHFMQLGCFTSVVKKKEKKKATENKSSSVIVRGAKISLLASQISGDILKKKSMYGKHLP